MKLLVTADWHLRSDKPRCRADEDWMETQRKAVNWVYCTAEKRHVPVCIVGDIFHRGNDHISILNMFLHYMYSSSVNTYILPGNHDLLYHNISYIDISLYGALYQMMRPESNLSSLSELGCSFAFGTLKNKLYKNEKIVFLHELTFVNKKEAPPGTHYYTAEDLLDVFPDAEWIFTGDNHHEFNYTKNGRHVINPGCLLRQTADMKDYQPVVYFVNIEKGTIEKISVPDDASMVVDEYLVQKKERDERIMAFVQSIPLHKEISLSFRDNLLERMKQKGIDQGTKDVVHECLKEIKDGNKRI